MKTSIFLITVLIVLLPLSSLAQNKADGKLLLKDNWAIQSSKEIKAEAKTISMTGFKAEGWYPTSVPTTVLAALVANKVYPDPYYGTNFNDLPGIITYPKRAMPDDSPFKVAWWYRTEFKIPADFKNMHTWLQFHSINYKANVWLNGKLI
ncbi:MAG TPA: glycoside hydrolase family 2, partial [Bacteroidales bacterium]|nr:glycoside hydrolase family 2 [Bacteroidales bacterium]